jgi:hypothetical protein
VGGLPWGWLIHQEHRPRLVTVLASRFAASGANAVLPLLGFGGDVSRLLWLAPRRRTVGLAALIVDRLVYAAAGGLVVLFLSVTVLVALPLPGWLTGLGIAAAVLTTLLALAGALMAGRGNLGTRVSALLGRWRRLGELVMHAGEHLDAELRRIIKGRGALCATLLAHVTGRALLALEVYAGMHVLGIDVGVPGAAVMAAVPVTLSLVTSWVPSQLGVQESAQAMVAAALGLDPAAGVALVLLQRIRQIVFVSLAGLLFVTMPGAEASRVRDLRES